MIERYKSQDFEELFALNNLCYCVDERPDRAEFEQMVTTSEVWVDRGESPKIISCIIVNERVARFPYLWSVFVHPDYRKRAYASYLIGKMKEKYSSMELHVRTDNSAQKLYFDHGFRVVEILPKWYRIDGKFVPGLKMRRDA